MWIFIGIITSCAAALGGLLRLDARSVRHRRSAVDADELEAARLRLVAAGEDPDDPAVFEGTGSGNIYTSRNAFDERTAALVVDPTLTVSDVADAVRHVEAGVGSLASFAAQSSDTREMRTGAEQKHLESVYDEAHDEDVRRDFDRAFDAAAAEGRSVWAAVDAWVERYHGAEHYANCVHCAETLHEHSDEFAQLVTRVEAEHTGEIPRDMMRRIMADADA